MRYNPRVHRRRSIRKRTYDYAASGAYFVTLCARGREHVFGRVEGGAMAPNPFRKIVEEEWMRTAEMRPGITLDAFVVMPNHFHGILWIVEDDGAAALKNAARRGAQMCAQMKSEPKRAHGSAPLRRQPRSLGSVIADFKSATTTRINALRGAPGAPVWQRNYYERILRDGVELSRTREYIAQNPARWDTDCENPDRAGKPDEWEIFLHGDTPR